MDETHGVIMRLCRVILCNGVQRYQKRDAGHTAN